MQGLYKRFEKWRGPKDLIQIVTTNPEGFLRIRSDRSDRSDRSGRSDRSDR
jgi:hypothetical protein